MNKDMFLSESELQKLTGYEPSQRKRMCRWLRAHQIPFETNRLGDPVVLRSDIEVSGHDRVEPNLDWLRTA